jgi:GGDEF domain-containing protein
MFNIVNLPEINQKYSRELGNKVITEISNYVKENISKDYIFVRYMGPKFVIVFSGAEVDDVVNFLKDLKTSIEKFNISLEDEVVEEVKEIKPKRGKKKKERAVAIPRLNIVLSTYYKGTGIEEVLNKLEEYLDNSDITESDITSI